MAGCLRNGTICELYLLAAPTLVAHLTCGPPADRLVNIVTAVTPVFANHQTSRSHVGLCLQGHILSWLL